MIDTNPWENASGFSNSDNQTPGQFVASPFSISHRKSVTDINLKRLIALWPWVLGSLLLFLVAAKLYIRYQQPIYQSILQVSMTGDEQSLNLGTTSLFDTRNPMNDKADLLKAPTTIRSVVDSLHLDHQAILKGRLKNKDLYNEFAWRAYRRDSAVTPFSFIIHPGKNNKSFSWQKNGLSGNGEWGVPFAIGRDSVIAYSFGKFDEDDEIICTRHDAWDMAFAVAKFIKVTVPSQSNTAVITYEDNLKDRANDVLTRLVEAYNHHTIAYKSKGLVQSISFMNERIAPLSGELDSIESGLARFKSSKGIVGPSAPGVLYLEQTAQLDQQANAINLQRQTLEAIERYVTSPNTNDENFSLVGLNDSYLEGMVNQYQQLRVERDKISMVATAENPNRKLIEKQLNQTRENIFTQLKNYRSTIGLQQSSVNKQLGQAQGLLRSTPANEKQLLEKQRQQNIKESLFLLLLQKREEASISLASTTADVRILAPARSDLPVSPKPLLIYGIALGIGLLLPLAIGVAREFLNHTITSKQQLEQMVHAPVLATVDQATQEGGEQFAIVSKNDRSVAAEQIRGLRAALKFYEIKGQTQVILVTSSFSGEGKTFLSSNLAMSYALLNLRVALLEFDMRKPKLAKRMGIHAKEGLSTVLLGNSDPSTVYVADKEIPNLHLYPTGPIPPNPSELMAMEGMEVLKAYLHKNYDVVIVDTPPVGLVADAQLLSKWANVNIVVVRFGVTPRDLVQEIESWNKQGRLGKMALVLNGVQTTGYYGYRYSSYYYRNKYGYEYYSSDKKKKK